MSQSGQDFGANDWLVEEMYERYQSDPTSVPSEWVTYFQNNPQAGSATQTPASGTPNSGTPGAGTPPTPKPVTPPNISMPGTPAPVPVQQAPAAPAQPVQQAPTTPVAPVTPAAPAAPVVTPAPVAPAAPAQPVQTQPVVRNVATTPATPADPIAKPIPTLVTPSASKLEPIRGVSARVVQSMEGSLTVPTATSVRTIPAKLMIDNRIVVNNHLKRGRGGKVSFTHIIAYAMIKALRAMPEMNAFYGELEGKPALGTPDHINLGIAIDLAKPDGSRQLLVPSIKGCEALEFGQFWVAYEEIVKKARAGTLTVEDYAGTTVSLTNPGTIGTVHSVPRLVQNQGLIIGVGAMDYPAEFQGASEETLARMAISKVITLTSTYDHRVIQGAQSGDFLRRIHEFLLGADGFYDEIFTALRIPYEPIRWAPDFAVTKDEEIDKTARVQQLIHAYRTWGHLMADIDPLVYMQRNHPDLDVRTHGLTLWDLDREFATGGFGGKTFLPLRKILGILRDAYCRSVGIEYMHISSPTERKWVQEKVEGVSGIPAREEQLRILRTLNSAEAFESFLQTKFVGQKRFSLEGGESVIPLTDAIVSAAAESGLDEVCIGMPHRGRLNMLANIAGKSVGQIFQEFQGHYAENQVHGSGDVKYHLGTEGIFTAESGATTKIYLAANPSHLEAVNPVLEGIVRAKQDRLNTKGSYTVLPILLHGDASFAGQGVNAEVLQLSQLPGYRTGGTIHIVVNNQVGFTTSPHSSRTSRYSTDVAKLIEAPVFHVNGDDPEACVRVARLAFEYRQEFNKDVVIDMVCYRRRGHNEGDEPSFTQPLMYKLIDAKRTTRTLYTDALVGRGDITPAEADEIARDYQAQLEEVFASVANYEEHNDPNFVVPIVPNAEDVPTFISEQLIREIAATQTAIPEGFNVHPKLLPQLQRRA